MEAIQPNEHELEAGVQAPIQALAEAAGVELTEAILRDDPLWRTCPDVILYAASSRCAGGGPRHLPAPRMPCGGSCGTGKTTD